MKKIYINGKFFGQRITGTQRYARELLSALDNLLSEPPNENLSVEILVPRCAVSVPAYKRMQVSQVGRMVGTKWEQIELPQHCRDALLFTLSGGAPVVHSRNVVTIHDAAVVSAPSGYSVPYRLWHRSVCRRMARHAEHIFTNSNFSRSEIVNLYGANTKSVSVTYLGSDHFSRITPDRSVLAQAGITGKYVLAVSSLNPNKNFERVETALGSVLGTQFVIAGAPDSRVYGKPRNLSGSTRILGYVTDAELKALYENAACFVFTSLYEGFGLPPLEALSSGCPVVLSRIPPLTELFDGIASFCDPYDPLDIADKIKQVIQSPRPNRTDLQAFASRFTWEKCARKTLDVLSRLP